MSGDKRCESCNNYVYDEEYQSYECESYFDEDELSRLLEHSHYQCPHYQSNDDYRIVRKQI